MRPQELEKGKRYQRYDGQWMTYCGLDHYMGQTTHKFDFEGVYVFDTPGQSRPRLCRLIEAAMLGTVLL